MVTDFESVTELPGEPITAEQLERLVNRYVWAAGYCHGADVVEAACGAGPGLGLLQSVARSVEAGDISPQILSRARAHYGSRIGLQCFDAQDLPYDDASKDVVMLFEAIYYLGRPDRFVRECARVLRPEGRVLIATANKNLRDFHPSTLSRTYFSVPELDGLFSAHGFSCEFYGFQAANRSKLRERALRPLKRVALAAGMIPKTMAGKRWLKRIVFGPQTPMPTEISADMAPYAAPTKIGADAPDQQHKIIYCVARCEKPIRPAKRSR